MNRTYLAPGRLDSLRTSAGSCRRQGGPAIPTGPLFVMILALTLSSGLTGCQSLGLPTPQTFEEKLAAGYTSVTAVRGGALTYLQSVEAKGDPAKSKAAADDAANIQAQADDARKGLDVARGLKAVDFKSADARLTSTLAVLTALQTYLEARR